MHEALRVITTEARIKLNIDVIDDNFELLCLEENIKVLEEFKSELSNSEMGKNKYWQLYIKAINNKINEDLIKKEELNIQPIVKKGI